jgi:hypothetical protein
MQQYKETHLPVTAKKHIVNLNRKLPAHLRHEIKEVNITPVAEKGVSNPQGVEMPQTSFKKEAK